MNSFLIITLFILSLTKPNITLASNELYCPNETGIFRHECLSKKLEATKALMEKEIDSALGNIISTSHIPIQKRAQWQSELIQSQEMWSSYKDKTCEIKHYKWWGAAGGSGASNETIICHISLTLNRIATLRSLKP